jgi:hypothetical protein
MVSDMQGAGRIKPSKASQALSRYNRINRLHPAILAGATRYSQ